MEKGRRTASPLLFFLSLRLRVLAPLRYAFCFSLRLCLSAPLR
jgi:hypothetical protein